MACLDNALRSGGMAIIAQQATRQRYLFESLEQFNSGEGILPTVSAVLMSARHDPFDISVIPIGVIPHSTDAKPTLNLFRRYRLNVGTTVPSSNLANLKRTSSVRPADFFVLHAIATLLPREYHYKNPSVT